jgi:hypothetical protein
MSLDTREFLRHTLATLAYRCNKTLRDAPEGFANFSASEIKNTPLDLLAHIGDLLEWTLNHCKGNSKYNHSTPTDWQSEVERFYTSLKMLDSHLSSQEPINASLERLFQGPIADALTHVGQLALLRRMAGLPIQGENFFSADIQAGQFDDKY